MENRSKEEDPEIQRPLVETPSEAPEKAKGVSTVADGAARSGSSGSAGKAISSCFLYSFCSVSMLLVNKSLASSYNHLIQGDLNFLLAVIQAIVAVVAVEFCKFMKWVEYPKFNISTAKQWAPVNILFCGMLFTGMASLQYNSVPMVTVFKNITNILTTIGDYYFFGTTVEGLIIAAFGIMLGGAILAAKNDHEIHAIGLFWMAANCVSTAGYVLYMKFATKNVKLTKFGMVFYNNVLCTLFLLPVTIVNGELSLFLNTDAIHTFDYAWKNSFAGFVGFFLNFASLNCVSNTGPTTYAIVGSLNKVPTAILGWILFNAQITPQTWFFIAVSMCGGFLYSYAKLRPSKRKVSTATRDN
jgi:GDP-mannose transporter